MKAEFILNWFAERNVMKRDDLEKNMKKNYFDLGLIDSFAFLELIALCEETFGIVFDDDDFSDDDFFTISGIIDILERKK